MSFFVHIPEQIAVLLGDVRNIPQQMFKRGLDGTWEEYFLTPIFENYVYI